MQVYQFKGDTNYDLKLNPFNLNGTPSSVSSNSTPIVFAGGAGGPSVAAIFKPAEGRTLKFLGNTVTCKFNPDERSWHFYELLATVSNPVPLHRHPWDEISYLLEGEVDLQIENQIVQATPGYFINLPAGVAHAFNVRSAQAKFLVGTSNAIAVHFMAEMAQAEQAQQLTPERLMAIAQNHQVQVVAD